VQRNHVDRPQAAGLSPTVRGPAGESLSGDAVVSGAPLTRITLAMPTKLPTLTVTGAAVAMDEREKVTATLATPVQVCPIHATHLRRNRAIRHPRAGVIYTAGDAEWGESVSSQLFFSGLYSNPRQAVVTTTDTAIDSNGLSLMTEATR